MPVKKKKKRGSTTGKKKRKSSIKGKKSAAKKSAEEKPQPPAYGYVKLFVMLATFAGKPKYPCHFYHVFRKDLRLQAVIDEIRTRHDNTIDNIVLFQGEVSMPRGDVRQSGEVLSPRLTIQHLPGVPTYTQDEAESVPNDQAPVIFYDYVPDVDYVTAQALVTQDAYFLKHVSVATGVVKPGSATKTSIS